LKESPPMAPMQQQHLLNPSLNLDIDEK